MKVLDTMTDNFRIRNLLVALYQLEIGTYDQIDYLLDMYNDN
jgi:hypothetical protein